MQTVKTILIILIFTAFLGACGNKGPLYLPEEKPATERESAAETDAEKKDKKKKAEVDKAEVDEAEVDKAKEDKEFVYR